MSVPDGTGSGESPNLFTSVRSFWSVLVAILYTRLDLASTELEDEAHRGIKLVLFGLIGVLSVFMAFFFAMLFLLAAVWDTEYRLWVIAGIFLIYALGGGLLLYAAWDMVKNRPRFLGQTLAELRRDVEGLNKAVHAKPEETAS